MKNNRHERRESTNAFSDGRLTARRDAARQAHQTLNSRTYSLDVSSGREALLRVPAGNAAHGIGLLENYADRFGIVLLAPKSLRQTWDVIIGGYGADAEFINHALDETFERCSVDSSRLAIGGFSDGASYALSLGIINGDLFSHVAAFSPGFTALTGQSGAPRIYISHGANDGVLPVERCSRRIVPQLKKAGYDVIYREFEGAHTIPPEISREAVEWFTNENSAA